MTGLEQLERDLLELKVQMSTPDAALVHLFLKQIAEWRDGSSTVEKLDAALSRTLGHVWFSTNESHTLVHQSLSRFRDSVRDAGAKP